MEVIVDINEEYLEDFLNSLKHYDKDYVKGYRFEPNEILKRDIYNSLKDIKNREFKLVYEYSNIKFCMTDTCIGLSEHLKEKFGFEIIETFSKFFEWIENKEEFFHNFYKEIEVLQSGEMKGFLTKIVNSDMKMTMNYMKLNENSICFFIVLPMEDFEESILQNLDLIINQMYYRHWEY